MSLTQTITCDVCGITKREANHWFTYLDQPGQVSFYRWSEADYRVHNHLCSEKCCIMVLSRKLTAWSSKESPPAGPPRPAPCPTTASPLSFSSESAFPQAHAPRPPN